MATPGPQPILTEDLTLKIRKLYLDGLNYKQIQETLEINDSTWDSWVYKDYKDFRANLKKWKHEKLIEQAEANLPELLASEDLNIKTKNTHFTLETLGKAEGYTKRTELTGEDGKDLTIGLINYGDKKDDTNSTQV